MATLGKAKASLLALILLVDIVSFSCLVAASPIAMDQSDIEGYHDNTLPKSTTMGNTWTANSLAGTVGSDIMVTPSYGIESAGIPEAWGGSGSSTDDTVGSLGSDLGTSDTGYGNANHPADSISSKVSESTKRSTPTEPVTGGGSTNNGVNGGATNTGSGTNVNVNTGAANGDEKDKDKGVVDTLLGKLTSIIKTLR